MRWYDAKTKPTYDIFNIFVVFSCLVQEREIQHRDCGGVVVVNNTEKRKKHGRREINHII